MPNIIINNYCNQKCEYCFAEANMADPMLQKQMSLSTFLSILRYLQIYEQEVRILGGEPLLHPNIRQFLKLSLKGGFSVIIFSNINIPNKNIRVIFEGITGLHNLRVNCNINHPDFYSEKERERIKENICYLQELGISVIIGHNIYTLDKSSDFIFQLAKETNVEAVNIKVTNSSIGEDLIIDTGERKFGEYIFGLLKRAKHQAFIEISCGLDASIFSESERKFIEEETDISLRFGCDGNIGKFDINTDGNIFKCFPLESVYKKNPLSIRDCLVKKMSIEEVISYLYIFYGVEPSDGECIGNRMIRSQKPSD